MSKSKYDIKIDQEAICRKRAYDLSLLEGLKEGFSKCDVSE